MIQVPVSKDRIYIDVEAIKENDWSFWFYYLAAYDQIFLDFESYRRYFLELGHNNPNGLEMRYFIELTRSYTQQQALLSLMSRGLVEEMYTAEGDVFYRMNVNLDNQ